MLKQTTLFLFAFLLSSNSFLNAQDIYLEWAKSFQGRNASTSLGIMLNRTGDVYTTGTFMDTVDFDPGTGVAEVITPDKSYGDCFIARLDASGNYKNAFYFGGMGAQDIGQALISDTNNNMYATGYFQKSADFNPNKNDSFVLTTAGQNDIYIAKYDANNNFVWAKRYGDAQSNASYAIALDKMGNIYSTGLWNNNLYLFKTNPQGDTLWSKTIKATKFLNFGNSIQLDQNNNVYISGYFWGISFLPNYGNTDAFIMKYDTDGNFQWAHSIGGIDGDQGRDIEVDDSGNVYSSGLYYGKVDFNPKTGPSDTFYLNSKGNKHLVVCKFKSNGDFVWAKSFGSGSNMNGGKMCIDSKNNLYVAGGFSTDITIDAKTYTADGISDIFVVKSNSNGDILWSKQIGSAGSESCSDIAVDQLGKIHITGTFTLTSNFDVNGNTFNLTSAGQTDVFVAKYSQYPLALETPVLSNVFLIYPNPSLSDLTVRFNGFIQGQTVLKIFDFNGKEILVKMLESDEVKIDLSALTKGIYTVEINNGNSIQTKTLIKGE